MKRKRERKRCSKQYRDSAERTDPLQPASYRTVIHPTPCKSTPSNSHSSLLKLGHSSPLLTPPTIAPIQPSLPSTPHSLPPHTPFLSLLSHRPSLIQLSLTCLGTRADPLSPPVSVILRLFFKRSLLLSISASCIASRIKSPSSGDCSISWRKDVSCDGIKKRI
jgi:hypothetical protein